MSDVPIKFDYCLVLSGKQGIGKSTLFSIMGGEWFTDSLSNFEGKDAMEAVQGVWIIELGELSPLHRSCIEQAKAFLSREEDRYRPSYGKNVESCRRQCVCCGTTNEAYFLKGGNGNRRFWIIPVSEEYRTVGADFFKALMNDRDQLWAETAYRWKQSESLFLSREMEKDAADHQSEANVNTEDPLAAQVAEFLKTSLPTDWDTRGLESRRNYWKYRSEDQQPTKPREFFCAAEFLCEVQSYSWPSCAADNQFRTLVKDINAIASALGWTRIRKRFKIYGNLHGFKRPLQNSS